MTEVKSFTNAESGDSIRFLRTAEATNGERLEVEVCYQPGSAKPPAHYHPHQEERFEVVAGSMMVELAGQGRTYHAGESFVVPKGTHHAMWNAGDTPAVLNWQTCPALNTQTFFETIWGLGQDGKLSARKPNLIQMAVLLRAYRAEFQLVSPPPWAQAVLFTLLGGLGRLFGYKARYEAYSR